MHIEKPYYISTIELNIIKWGLNGEKYDLRVWEKEAPLKGFTMSESEVKELCQVCAEFMGIE